MKKINRHLNEWTSKGLISSEQASSIRRYEEGKTSKNWVALSFLLLGATILAVGIISLTAANWYQIPDFLKLGVDFVLLAGLAYAVFRTWDLERKYIHEVLLTIFVLLVLGTIGLIAQIYQLGGKLYEALFLWNVLTLPAILFSGRKYLPSLWSVSFLVSSSFMLVKSHLFQQQFGNEVLGWTFIITFIPILCIMVSVLLKTVNKGEKFIKIFKELAILTGLLAIVVADIWISARVNIREHGQEGPYFGLLYWLPCYTLALSVLSFIFFKKMLSLKGRVILTILIAFHLSIFSIILTMNGFSQTAFINVHNLFSGAFLGIVFLLLASLLAGVEGQRKIFQTLVVFIGIRFLIVYFQAMGGLTRTGIGLVISGAVIIAMVYLWFKMRKRIETFGERLAGK